MAPDGMLCVVQCMPAALGVSHNQLAVMQTLPQPSLLRVMEFYPSVLVLLSSKRF